MGYCGCRLAALALAKTYKQKDIACSGPIYKSMRVEGLKIRLYFDYTYGELSAKEGHLSDFVIVGDTIVVSSGQVQKPIAVRYAWKNWAAGSLFNTAGLPASSFRTDDWNDDSEKGI
jgi:sialate O-acetylesterase